MATHRMQGARSIAVVGHFSSTHPAIHFARALREEEWIVTEIDDLAPFMTGLDNLGGKVAARLTNGLASRAMTKALVRANAEHSFDVILVLKGTWLRADTLQMLRAQGSMLVNWYPDFDFSHVGFDEAILSCYDAMVTTKRHHVAHLQARYPKLAVTHIEHGYCPLAHRPIVAETPDFDAIYVGNATDYKRALLRQVAADLPKRRFAIVGGDWNPATLAENVTYLGKMSGDEMSAAMGRARLALAFHMGPHGEYGWQDSVSARSFEIPACGVPMLHVQNDQIAALFEPEKEYLGFADAEQLVSQIERALDDPGLRARLARNAFERAVPAYSYVERGREISRFLEGRLNPTKNSSPAGKA